VRECKPFIQLSRRPQLASFAEKAIPSNRDSNGIALLLSWIGRRICAEEVAAYYDFGLDYGLAAEDDVGCADDL